MERWENRYAHSRSGAVRGAEHSRFERVRSILLILLTVALIGVSIAGGQAIALRGKVGDAILARMVTECNEAVTQVSALSRSGGSDSTVLVSKIRASIHAMDVLNSLYDGYFGGPVIQQSAFDALYATIDSYMAKLRNGTTTMEEQTNLLNDLTGLQSLLTGRK